VGFSIETLLQKSVDKKRITSDAAQQVKDRISTSTELSSLSESDFVIEAVPVRPTWRDIAGGGREMSFAPADTNPARKSPP
jgi:hypothetical protein